jgi:hypothetical protein
MSLALLAPVLERIQELRVHSSQASQVLGIDLVGLLLVGVDQSQFAGVGHQDLVATLLQDPARPGRVGASLDGYAHRLFGGEAPLEGFGAGTQPTLLHNLATVLVDEAEVGVLVAEIQSGCHLRLHFANIHGGPILLSLGRFRVRQPLQTLRVLPMGGRPSHLIFVELRNGEVHRISLPTHLGV